MGTDVSEETALPSKEQMVEIRFSEMLVLSYQTTRRHFPGDHDFSIF